MQQKGSPQEKILEELSQKLQKDLTYESGKILGSMCTIPHPLAKKVMSQCIEKNLGDPGLFKGTQEIEIEVVKMLGKLLNNPESWGYIVSGGTEANIVAMRIARNLARKKHKIKTPEVIIPQSAHASFDKAADLLGLRLIRIPLDKQYRVKVPEIKKAITKNTVAIVGIAGTTALGAVDPIPELSEIAIENDLYLHVDAAFGGMVLPFLEKLGYRIPEFDFRNPGVCSITIDPHKMGLSTIPCGTIAFSRPSGEELSVQTPYLTVDNQPTLSGTRSGGAVVGAYAVMRTLGWEGYERVVDGCMRTTHILKEGVEELGLDPVIEPECNVLVFSSKHPDRVKDALYHQGWSTSTSRSPHAVRCGLMPHTTEQLVLEFLDDLRNVVKDVE